MVSGPHCFQIPLIYCKFFCKVEKLHRLWDFHCRASFLSGSCIWRITRLRFQVKDAIHLLHLWLKKRELESRRVKDRDFSGIDIRELDLLPAFLTRLE